MAIISFDPDAIIDYIPEYAGNRESEDPCIVKLKYVPYSRVQHYARILSAKTHGEKDYSKIAEITQGIQRKQFIENVDSIYGYYVGVNEVMDASGFYETADTDLVIEVIRAMESQSKLTEGQRKNS